MTVKLCKLACRAASRLFSLSSVAILRNLILEAPQNLANLGNSRAGVLLWIKCASGHSPTDLSNRGKPVRFPGSAPLRTNAVARRRSGPQDIGNLPAGYREGFDIAMPTRDGVTFSQMRAPPTIAMS